MEKLQSLPGMRVECKLSVVSLAAFSQDSTFHSESLGTLGDAFLTETPSRRDPFTRAGADVNCCVLDIRIHEDCDGKGVFSVLCQTARPPLFTSYNKGPFATQVSVFVNVLEASGDTQLDLFNGRGAGISVGGRAKGEGWLHYHHKRAGFGGQETSSFTGKGRLKVAIALPYVGHGYHGGTPVWAGYVSDWYAEDTRALTSLN